MFTKIRRFLPAFVAALAVSAVAVPAMAAGASSTATPAVKTVASMAGGEVTGGSASGGNGTGGSASGGSATSYCGLVWGSLEKSAAGANGMNGTVKGVRSGQHECYDRLVVDLGNVPGDLRYDVRYVDELAHDGSGEVVPVSGGARLAITFSALWNPADAPGTYEPADRNNLLALGGYRTFRQVALVDNFEGDWTFGLGVRARLPFRVFELDGPGTGTRLVIDVAHRW